MVILRSLRDQLFKYRKHKPSLDGHIPGTSMSYHSGGPLYGHSGAPHDTPQHVEGYDPIHAHYVWSGPDYDPPEPWFAGLTIQPTPPLRLDPVEFETPHPPAIHYNDALMTDELLQTVLPENPDPPVEAVMDSVQDHAPQIPDDLSFADANALGETEMMIAEPVSPSLDLEGMVNQMYEEQNMAPELPDGFSQMENIHEQMNQSLEQIVNQEPESAMQPESFADPFEEDLLLKQQHYFDLQMQPFLNPFGPPGPGI